MAQTHALTAAWTIRAVDHLDEIPASIRDRLTDAAGIPAAVPGCVHTALLEAGLIPDPYTGEHEQQLQWIGRVDWAYRCRFEVPGFDAGHIDLLCEGLDTVATIHLNGVRLGEAENMHYPHRFAARPVLRAGDNELLIHFRSPVRYARQWEAALGTLPWLNTPEPFNFIRKMACNFGWDWGPVLTTAGPWKPVVLHAWDTARIEHVRPLVMRADAQQAELEVHIDLACEADARGEIAITLESPDGQPLETRSVPLTGQGAAATMFTIDTPQLWWPRGYGAQPLYHLRAELRDEQGCAIDHWSGRVGLRRAELLAQPDDIGRGFTIRINGRPIFCKGANWIPDDCFLDRACEPGRYRARIEQACGANMNMLRVWGGGIYETGAFYDACDELGVLVWQDFLFACAGYPEQEPFRGLVEREARYNIARLSRHASLVIWNGCNENLWGYHVWGWKEKGLVSGRTWGPGYYFDLLPRLCAELDPSRPYWPASPWSGDTDVDEGLDPNAATHGNKHVWEAWFGSDYEVYREIQPRFCSEFGFQGPATVATLRSVLDKEALQRGSAGLAHRQRSPGGDERNDRHLEKFFPLPSDFDRWHYLLQVNQARALTLGIEWFRSLYPRCAGTLYWQLNDCWPVTSWSAIDGGGRLKPLWYATRRAYAPRLLTFQPWEGGLSLCAINDTDEPWEGNLPIMRMDFVGRPQCATRADLTVPPRSVQRIALDNASLITPDDPSFEALTTSAEGRHAFWFFAPDRDLAYEAPTFDCDFSRDGATHKLTLTPHTLLRDVALFPDRLDPAATVNEQQVTLMPGEPYTFEVHCERPLDEQALTAPPVFQCVNRIGGQG